jgi:hypothetical protein
LLFLFFFSVLVICFPIQNDLRGTAVF